MGKNQTILDIAKIIKGESSNWINKNNITKDVFSWQDGYFASSVSNSKIEIVRNYIKNQEEHHKNYSFEDEYKKLIK